MKNTLFYFFTFSFLIVFSQKSIKGDYSFTISKPYKINDTRNRDYFTKEGEVLAIKYRKDIVYIQKYDSKLNEFISVKKYDDFEKKIIIERVIELNENYYLFYSLWSEDKSYVELYYREIDFDRGEFIGEKIKVFVVNKDIKTYNPIRYKDSGTKRNTLWLTYSKDNNKKFTFLKSEDETKLTIYYTEVPKIKSDKKSYDKTTFSVFTDKMKLLWNKTYTMPYTERIMDLLSTTLTSEGNILYLARVFHDESNQDFVDNKSNNHLELFKLSETNEEIITKIDFGPYYLSNVVIFEQNSFINCLGFYNGYVSNSDTFSKRNSGKRIPGNADGVFYIRIDKKSKNVIFDRKHEIPINVITKYLGKGGKKRMEGREEKDRAEFFDLKLRNIVFLQENKLLLIGEQLYVNIEANIGANGAYYGERESSYLKDLFVCKIDFLGNLEWMDRLAKRQSKTHLDKSFNHFFIDGKHYIAFLDNIKNLELKEENVPERYDDGGGRKGYLMVYEIDNETGEVKKDAIFDLKNITEEISGHLFDVNRMMKTKDDALLLELYKKDKEEILIKIQRN